jgi:hypothetical protein
MLSFLMNLYPELRRAAPHPGPLFSVPILIAAPYPPNPLPHLSLTLLEATLVDHLVSVGNKELTKGLSLLESALTKNMGVGGVQC